MHKVIVYSRPHCIECNVLKKFLKDYQIEYENRNCSTNPEYLEEVKKMGFLGGPCDCRGRGSGTRATTGKNFRTAQHVAKRKPPDVSQHLPNSRQAIFFLIIEHMFVYN